MSNKFSLIKVVKVIDPYTVVINKGEKDGLSLGTRFLIYCIEPEEIIDPDTGDSLGYLEIVRGYGSIVHLQEKIATIKTKDRKKSSRLIRKSPLLAGSFIGDEIEETHGELIRLEGVEVGDFAKPI